MGQGQRGREVSRQGCAGERCDPTRDQEQCELPRECTIASAATRIRVCASGRETAEFVEDVSFMPKSYTGWTV
jgi:hypothetical protein